MKTRMTAHDKALSILSKSGVVNAWRSLVGSQLGLQNQLSRKAANQGKIKQTEYAIPASNRMRFGTTDFTDYTDKGSTDESFLVQRFVIGVSE